MGEKTAVSDDGSSPPPPLFEAKGAKGRGAYRIFTGSVFVGVCLIWVYRTTHFPEGGGRRLWWAWMGMFAAELWFGFYWVLTQALRWKPVFFSTFKDRLSHRYEAQLPAIDIFICTADPTVEPPALVVNTALSAMAFDYPQGKISVYVSDDGGSKLTFYALLQAAQFAKHWIPFCRRRKVEPRSPAAYFSSSQSPMDEGVIAVKNLYKEMESRIDTAVKLGRIPDDLDKQNKGFLEWSSLTKSNDHHPIVKIVIDGQDPNSVDIDGFLLPTLVYLAREKRPYRHHNFKAGAMNALIRVSSAISNAPVILNLDCDMYSNNSEIIRDALCFLMDEENGHDIGYVQLPQNFSNITKNNLYGDSIAVVNEVEIPGMNGYGGPCYMGTGCFHRRESITGKKYSGDNRDWIGQKKGLDRNADRSISMWEERAKGLATCTYEDNTLWGTEMGLKYGCPVEDIVTGLSIQCKGWKSIYFNPKRKGFLGIAPNTLSQMLVQHKRWSEGMFQIFLCKYCPFLCGYGKIKLPLQMAYSSYLLWPPCSLAVLYYVVVSSLCLLNGIALFPEVSSLWFLPFMFVIFATYMQSLVEALWSGETLKGWWNMQRTWMMRRVVSYLFGFIDTVCTQLGITNSAFVITDKVADSETLERYKKEIMDFGPSSLMFTLLATTGLLQLLCLVGSIAKTIASQEYAVIQKLFLQFLMSGMLVLINIPIYEGMFLRSDKGRMPTLVTVGSSFFAVAVCVLAIE